MGKKVQWQIQEYRRPFFNVEVYFDLKLKIQATEKKNAT